MQNSAVPTRFIELTAAALLILIITCLEILFTAGVNHCGFLRNFCSFQSGEMLAQIV